jgi:DNA-binding NarL/FixJ family response regulator
MTRKRVLLADDHELVRAGIRELIAKFEGFEVAGEAGDGREAVRLARQIGPDVIVMDLTMPGLNGLDATAAILREAPATAVIVLSMHTAENYVLKALRVGAVGYVVKDAAVAELEQALRAVARGERYLSPKVSRHVLEDYLRFARGEQTAQPESPIEALSPRQREILQLIAEGHSTRQIAERLSLSVSTVESHRAQIMERLDIRDVAGLTRLAIRAGLISGED